jgi:GrpB-like predicted nucleotidyltransferase (UPF0157 family)
LADVSLDAKISWKSTIKRFVLPGKRDDDRRDNLEFPRAGKREVVVIIPDEIRRTMHAGSLLILVMYKAQMGILVRFQVFDFHTIFDEYLQAPSEINPTHLDEMDGVIISSYHSTWPEDFAAIKAELLVILGSEAIIEHVGSTSVPGLCAKPIIDVDILVPKDELSSTIAVIEAGGKYAHRGELGVPGRHILRFLGEGPARNVYACIDDCLAVRNHLIVRKTLRADPELRDRYGKAKMELAARGLGKHEYTEAKNEILQHILEVGGMNNADRQAIRLANSDIVSKVKGMGLLKD